VWAGRPGFSPREKRGFSLRHRAWGPPSNRSSGYTGGVKRPKHDVNHSPQAGAKIKNEYSFTSAHHALSLCGVQDKEQLCLYLSLVISICHLYRNCTLDEIKNYSVTNILETNVVIIN
jgi:hypothetical protein